MEDLYFRDNEQSLSNLSLSDLLEDNSQFQDINSILSKSDPLDLNSLESLPKSENKNESIESKLNKTMDNNEIDFNKEDNPFQNLFIPSLPVFDEKQIIPKESLSSSDNSKNNIGAKNTNFTSQKDSLQRNPKLILPYKSQNRFDYCIKYFKTYFSKFLKNYANKLISLSCLPNELKKSKLASPNSKSFTGNANQTENYKFLFYKVEDIFCFYKNENCQVSLQKKNKKIIRTILDYINGCTDEEKFAEIISFFKMSLEDAYELFYKSEYFKKYANDSKTIYLDKEFKAEKKYSILENNAFVMMLKGKKNN